jgi:hypothetical protein
VGRCLGVFVCEIEKYTKSILKETAGKTETDSEIEYRAYQITKQILKDLAQKETKQFFGI